MINYTVLVWVAGGLLEGFRFEPPYQMGPLCAPFLCMMMSALLMVELNNINALIRIYSRMVSCSFLALTCMVAFQFPSLLGAIAQLCFIASYICLFHSYQDKRATGWIFYGFFCLGMASTVFIQILFFVPFIWYVMARYLMSLSWRTFWASLIGLIAPYWFVAVYYLFNNNLEGFVSHFLEIARFEPLFVFASVGEHQIVTFSFIVLLALIGMVHFWRNSFYDKIRTRMLFSTFILMDILTIVFIVLQPQHQEVLLKLMIVNTAPLIGHFIALTRTRFTNVAFCVMLFVALFITVYNLWIPSLLY